MVFKDSTVLYAAWRFREIKMRSQDWKKIEISYDRKEEKSKGRNKVTSLKNKQKKKVCGEVCKFLQYNNWIEKCREQNLSSCRSKCIILLPSTRSSVLTSPNSPFCSHATSSGNYSTYFCKYFTLKKAAVILCDLSLRNPWLILSWAYD